MDRAETQQREEPRRTGKRRSGSVSPEPGKGLAGHRLCRRARKTAQDREEAAPRRPGAA